MPQKLDLVVDHSNKLQGDHGAGEAWSLYPWRGVLQFLEEPRIVLKSIYPKFEDELKFEDDFKYETDHKFETDLKYKYDLK